MAFKDKYWKTNVETFFSYQGKKYMGQWPTFREMMEISEERFPDNEVFKAIVPKVVTFTYKEALKKIREIAYYLIASGAKKGDHIAVTGKNSPEWALAYFAISFAGCIIVPLDYSLHIEDMEKILAFGDVDRIFIDGEKIDEIDKEGKLFKEKISLEPESKGYKYVLDLTGPETELPKLHAEDTAAMLFTSGTTGTPKGVMLSFSNFMSSTLSSQRLFDVYPTDVFYAILPIHHAYTMTAVLLETVISGASCVFGKRLVTPIMLKELREGKITMLLAVPMLFNKLLAGLMAGVHKQGPFKENLIHFLMGFSGFMKKVFHVNLGKKIFGNMLLSKISLDKMRLCICGGGPLPPSTFKQFNQLGIDFVQGYGLTETSPIININPIEVYIEESVGIPIPGVEEKIVSPDEDGNGIIYVRGPQVMKGYYKNDEATEEVLSSDGWLNTGDVGHIDSNGFLYLTGRAKSIIVTEGGKNVFPEEIEDKFQLFNEIEQCCIIPYMINKEMKTEGIRMVIYPTEAYLKEHGMEETSRHMEEVVESVNKDLQSYKKITMVTVVDQPLPMTSTKKVKRFEVVKMFK
ncbi:MAG: AMP-binding protein [Sphaerochaetaceae bacterium]|nr:AMP-binding protein [Sphaerochaetaceae bacterium]